ncbi:MAG: RES family NAD+ phosphorylase [Trichloromonadaceae bacterium]
MIIYRVTPAEFSGNLSGGGARRYGGRWNPLGVPALYTSNSTALCLLEILVNVRSAYLPALHRVVIEVPDQLIDPADPVFFADPAQSREHGLRWLSAGQWLGLKVASSILVSSQDAFNLILNPRHADFGRVRIVDHSPLPIDERLLGTKTSR